MQDIDIGRAAQHGFLGRSRVTSRDLQRATAGMVARGVYARTNDKHWGAFLSHRSKLWGLPVPSKALDRGELVRTFVRSIDSKGHLSNTFVFLHSCGLLHARLTALDPEARSPGRLLFNLNLSLRGLCRSDSCERFRGWRPEDGEEAIASRCLFMALVGSNSSRWDHGEVEAMTSQHINVLELTAFLNFLRSRAATG